MDLLCYLCFCWSFPSFLHIRDATVTKIWGLLILHKGLFGIGVLCYNGALFCLTTYIVLLILFLRAVSRCGINHSLNFHKSGFMQFY